jgi:hypothetical protein
MGGGAMTVGRSMLLAALVGLAAASIPVLATRGRCAEAAPAEAPLYLLVASDATATQLRCGPAGDHVRFERVASGADVERRIFDPLVGGIAFDRTGLAIMPDALKWVSAGDGRAIVGLQVTHWEMECGCPARAHVLLRPEERGESTDLVGRTFLGHASYERTTNGVRIGRGTRTYDGEKTLGEFLATRAGSS